MLRTADLNLCPAIKSRRAAVLHWSVYAALADPEITARRRMRVEGAAAMDAPRPVVGVPETKLLKPLISFLLIVRHDRLQLGGDLQHRGREDASNSGP